MYTWKREKSKKKNWKELMFNECGFDKKIWWIKNVIVNNKYVDVQTIKDVSRFVTNDHDNNFAWFTFALYSPSISQQ